MRRRDRTHEQVERAIQRAGLGQRIEGVRVVGGGSINECARLETDSGTTLFLKSNATASARMFEAEAAGLTELRTCAGWRVPEPIAWGGDDDVPAWLLMEYIEPGPSRADSDRRLGEALAALHSAETGATFGWGHDNWIGALEQSNTPTDAWGAFWRDQRISPQLEAARRKGHLGDTVFDRVAEATPEALSDVSTPCLLHGDLWSGNAFTAEDGAVVVVDPALYRGDGEVDLAMTELFGGFGPAFYEAYAGARDISAEYRSHRKPLYQLYYLIVHVNLFGASYSAAALRTARRVLAEID